MISDDNRAGWALFGNQFVNGDIVKVKVEVLAASQYLEAGEAVKVALAVCSEEQSQSYGTAAYMDEDFYINNTVGYITQIQTLTISHVDANKPYVLGVAYNGSSAQYAQNVPLKFKWYFYKV